MAEIEGCKLASTSCPSQKPVCRECPIPSVEKMASISPHILTMLYASGADKPVVYEVIPEGDIEVDPDANAPGVSFACPKARIIALKKVPGRVIRRHQNKMRQEAAKPVVGL
jgi:hypothetical protein